MTSYSVNSEDVRVHHRKMQGISPWAHRIPHGANPNIAPSAGGSNAPSDFSSVGYSISERGVPQRAPHPAPQNVPRREPHPLGLLDGSKFWPDMTMEEYEAEVQRQRPPPIVPSTGTPRIDVRPRRKSTVGHHGPSTVVPKRQRASSQSSAYYSPPPTQASSAPTHELMNPASGFPSGYSNPPRGFIGLRDSITGAPACQGHAPFPSSQASSSNMPHAFMNVQDSITGIPAHQGHGRRMSLPTPISDYSNPPQRFTNVSDSITGVCPYHGNTPFPSSESEYSNPPQRFMNVPDSITGIPPYRGRMPHPSPAPAHSPSPGSYYNTFTGTVMMSAHTPSLVNTPSTLDPDSLPGTPGSPYGVAPKYAGTGHSNKPALRPNALGLQMSPSIGGYSIVNSPRGGYTQSPGRQLRQLERILERDVRP